MELYDQAAYVRLVELELIVGMAPSGISAVSLFEAPQCTVGCMPLRPNKLVPGDDLQPLREALGWDVMGFIGMDFLRDKVLSIDCDNGSVVFMKRVTGECGQEVPLYMKNNPVPSAYFEIEGWALEQFFIDTGFCGFSNGCVRDDILRSLLGRQLAERLNISTYLADTSGGRDTVLHRIRGFSIDKLVCHGLVFSPSYVNLLGLNYLSRYRVTFDFPNAKMYLAKGRRFDSKEQLPDPGIRFARRGGRTVIGFIEKDGLAEKCGLQLQDELVKVGHRSVSDVPMFTLHKMLTATDTVELHLRRADWDFHVSLNLGKSGDPR